MALRTFFASNAFFPEILGSAFFDGPFAPLACAVRIDGACVSDTILSETVRKQSFQRRECVMLVLTRKQNETIQIGDSITITVLRMKGKSVRLGIKAPHDTNVIRGELAFELPGEEAQLSQVEEAEVLDMGAKARARSVGVRQDKSWSTASEALPAAKVGCIAAWSV
jgi:carbon storage regulator CsrA